MLQDIFTQGTLEMSATPLPALESAAKWSDLLSNRIIAVAVIFIIIIDLPDLIGTFPHILDCMTNKRGSIRRQKHHLPQGVRQSIKNGTPKPFLTVKRNSDSLQTDRNINCPGNFCRGSFVRPQVGMSLTSGLSEIIAADLGTTAAIRQLLRTHLLQKKIFSKRY